MFQYQVKFLIVALLGKDNSFQIFLKKNFRGRIRLKRPNILYRSRNFENFPVDVPYSSFVFLNLWQKYLKFRLGILVSSNTNRKSQIAKLAVLQNVFFFMSNVKWKMIDSNFSYLNPCNGFCGAPADFLCNILYNIIFIFIKTVTDSE